MSSPSPGLNQMGEMPYQPEPGVIEHLQQQCLCPEMPQDDVLCNIHKPHVHHHNVIGLSHPPSTTPSHLSQVHVHVHASPKTREVAKSAPPTCNCHLGNSDSVEIIQDANIIQTRKLDDDSIEVSPLPPALPPRPPPRPRTDGHGTLPSRMRSRDGKKDLILDLKFFFPTVFRVYETMRKC